MYTIKEKEQVFKAIEDGMSVKEISKLYNIPVSTIYKWRVKKFFIKTENKVIEENKKVVLIQDILKEIAILTRNEQYEEALKLCKEYESNINIQVQHIRILSSLERYEEALEICDLPTFYSNKNIQIQKLIILRNLEKYEEILKLLEEPRFKQCDDIQGFRSSVPVEILMKHKNKKRDMEQKEKDNISYLYTKIYLGDIKLNEIDNSEISEFDKIILKLLYFEKNKMPGLNIIKEAKKTYADDFGKMKILNKMYKRFETKNLPFLDYTIYSQVLKCELNQDMIDEYNKKEAKKQEELKKIVLPQPTKKQEETKKVQSIKKVEPKHRVATHKTNIISSTYKPKEKVSLYRNNFTTPTKEKKVKQIDISNLKIKDIYSQEVFEIKKYIYVQMNNSLSIGLVNAWDNFCLLVEKNITDEKALLKFIAIARYVSKTNKSNIDINILEEKRNKYIRPSC